MENHRISRAAVVGCVLGLFALTGCASAPAPAASPELEPLNGLAIGAEMTGSVSSLDASRLASGSTGSVVDMIEGRLAGVRVVRTSNGISLRIRGENSIMSNKEPLLVIDGIRIGATGVGPALAMLNASDIARIDVLKDASSTAIYGMRGVNGVILIETERGR